MFRAYFCEFPRYIHLICLDHPFLFPQAAHKLQQQAELQRLQEQARLQEEMERRRGLEVQLLSRENEQKSPPAEGDLAQLQQLERQQREEISRCVWGGVGVGVGVGVGMGDCVCVGDCVCDCVCVCVTVCMCVCVTVCVRMCRLNYSLHPR